jgi:hypothetical protein
MSVEIGSEEHREMLVRWVRENGLDPADIPADAKFDVTDDQITVEVVVRDADGSTQLDPRNPNQVLRVRRTVLLLVPYPSDIGATGAPVSVTDLSKFEVHAIHCNDDTSDVAMWCVRDGCDFQFDGQPDEIVPLSELVRLAEAHTCESR